MKRILLVIAFLMTFTSFISLSAQWAKTYGGNKGDNALLIQQTKDGGYIVAGDSYSYGAAYYDLLILKLDSNGAIEWQNYYRSSYYKNLLFVEQTNDEGYLVACNGRSFSQEYEIWIIKLNSAGALEVQFCLGRVIDNIVYCFQQTSDRGFILGGAYLSLTGGKNNIWISRLTSTADIVWQRLYSGSDDDSLRSIQQTSDGAYIVAGNTLSSSAQDNDIWVLKLSSAGDIEWQRTYGGANDDSLSNIKQTSGGGYIIGGETRSFGAGEDDIWIIKLNPSGEIEWQRTYGGSNEDFIYNIRQTNDGGYIVGGNTQSFGAGAKDFWILRLTPSGDIEWQKTFGTLLDEEANSIQQTSDGGYVIAGNISAFGAGSNDFLVLKLLADGTIGKSCRFLKDSNAKVSNTSIVPKNTDIVPKDITIIHESAFPAFSQNAADSTVFPLCSEKPLLAIHATEGGTTDPLPGTYIRDSGEQVPVLAIPMIKFRFEGWSGDTSGTDDSVIVDMNMDKFIIASFIQRYTLTIDAGTGGTTSPQPGTYVYDKGREISITATPESDYKFSGWSGDESGTDNPIQVILNSDKLIRANFARISEKPAEKNPLDDIFRIATCSIATAAYGSPLHPYVRVLQDFRDRYLMTSKLGRTLVKFYYKNSPAFAQKIAKHKALKILVQVSLIPLVAFSYLMVCSGPLIASFSVILIFAVPTFFIIYRRKKRRAKRTSSFTQPV
jgi:uncharacterized delta-60 repeat protein